MADLGVPVFWGTSVPGTSVKGTSDLLGNIGTVFGEHDRYFFGGKHRTFWGTSVQFFGGNIGTGEHRSGEHRTFWGTSVPGNIGTGEHRYRGTSVPFFGFLGNIGTGEQRYRGT